MGVSSRRTLILIAAVVVGALSAFLVFNYVNSADDKFMMQIHFAMAKKSSDDTSQFVRRDVESKLLRGEYPGKVPPGYLNITRAGHIAASQSTIEKESILRTLGRPLRREEIDPIDGPIVKALFEEAARGSSSLSKLRKLSFTLEPGQTRYIRTAVGMGVMVGRVYPELVDSATGEKEVQETSYTGATAAQR